MADALGVSLIVLVLALVGTWMVLARQQAMIQRAREETRACARGLRQLIAVVEKIPGAPAIVLDPGVPADDAVGTAPVGTEPVVVVRARPWRVMPRDTR